MRDVESLKVLRKVSPMVGLLAANVAFYPTVVFLPLRPGIELSEEIAEVVDWSVSRAKWRAFYIFLPVPDDLVLIELLADVLNDGLSKAALGTVSIFFQLGESKTQVSDIFGNGCDPGNQ